MICENFDFCNLLDISDVVIFDVFPSAKKFRKCRFVLENENHFRKNERIHLEGV